MNTQTELLRRHLEQCEVTSRANPKKTVKVSSDYYFLTVGKHLWRIVYESHTGLWHSFTNDTKGWETEETLTRREQVAILLSTEAELAEIVKANVVAASIVKIKFANA